jgi:hypothetical protein
LKPERHENSNKQLHASGTYLLKNSTNTSYESQNLYERLQDLAEIPAEEWTPEHQLEYEKCDKKHIDGMLAAE